MNNEKFFEYQEYITEKLDAFTNELISEIMERENVVSGDILPEQMFELDKHYEIIAGILLKVVEQNEKR